MARKKKEEREYHVSTTDSPSWDVVQEQREGTEQRFRGNKRMRGTPGGEDPGLKERQVGPGVSAPGRTAR